MGLSIIAFQNFNNPALINEINFVHKQILSRRPIDNTAKMGIHTTRLLDTQLLKLNHIETVAQNLLLDYVL